MRRSRLFFALAAAMLALWSQAAMAWGALGHRTVAQIALANISPRTQAAITRLLAAGPALDTPECPVRSLADASIWPDCLRRAGPRWADTFAWHYQDAPVCAADFNPAVACRGGACVTAQIARQRRLLADRALPSRQRLQALAFLVHFIGDVHQPLHAADDGDRGGNEEIVRNAPPTPAYGGAPPRPVSLHWFWDDMLVQRALAPPAPSLVRRYGAQERARLATGGPVDWARESWRLAVTLAYPQAFGKSLCGHAPPRSVIIREEDSRRDLPVVRERLVRAGLRLARVLDETLGG